MGGNFEQSKYFGIVKKHLNFFKRTKKLILILLQIKNKNP